MHIIFILIGVLSGAAGFGIPGSILGGVVGYLVAELTVLKKRITLLESQRKTAQVKEAEDIVFTPVGPDDVNDVAEPVAAKKKLNHFSPVSLLSSKKYRQHLTADQHNLIQSPKSKLNNPSIPLINLRHR